MCRYSSVPVRNHLLCSRAHVVLTPSLFSLPFSETHPNYELYRHRLAKGWLPGTQIVSFASRAFLSHHGIHRLSTRRV